MRLQAYLDRNGITQTAFANILSDVVNRGRAPAMQRRLAKQQVQRLCAATRAPSEDLMAALYIATGGKVQPNDFYELPDLDARGAAPECAHQEVAA